MAIVGLVGLAAGLVAAVCAVIIAAASFKKAMEEWLNHRK